MSLICAAPRTSTTSPSRQEGRSDVVRAATVFLAVLALLQPLLFAQRFEVPVRRAEPATPAQPDEPVQPDVTPSPSEPPTPPAVPFDFDNPPKPARARPAASSPALRPAATPAPAEATNPDDIRVAPNVGQTPEKAQINFANGLYVRKLYDLAAPEYERYLGI